MIDKLLSALRIPNNSSCIPVPSGTKLLPSDLMAIAPDSNLGIIAVESIDGFMAYLKRYNSDDTIVFASLRNMRIAAVFDWHNLEIAGWGEHVAAFDMSFGKEWQDWTGIFGKQLTQQQFAEFVEEHLDNICEPSAAEVLTVATSLSGMRKVKFTNAVRLQNGDTSLQWEENTEAKAAGDTRVPSTIKIRVPVIKGAENETTFEVTGLFRYRINEGRLSFEVKLLHVEDIAEQAFDSLITNLKQSLTAEFNKDAPPVVNGSINRTPRSILTSNIHTA